MAARDRNPGESIQTGTDRSARGARTPLSRERVIEGAMAVADAGGLGALTIRSLADHLGVKPMAIYHHVANKEDILDALVDRVFAAIDLPVAGNDWRAEMQRRAASARAVLGEHPWAIGLLDSRTSPGPATLAHHEAVLATLRAAGFSVPLAAHAVALLDSYVYGFALQEATLPFGRDTDVSVTELANAVLETVPSDAYPHFVEVATELVLKPGYDFGNEFGWGLELILDGLATAFAARGATPTTKRGRSPRRNP